MSRPTTSYVYLTAEQAGQAYELFRAGDVAMFTADDGHTIHVQLGAADEDEDDE